MIVADTNFIAYLLVAGPFSAEAQRAFDQDGKWLAPSVRRHEFPNVRAMSVRNGLLDHGKALDTWAHAPAFVKDAEVPPLEVFDLSVTTKFATFDCYYVVPAQKLGLPLVTADKKLLNASPDVARSIEDFAAGR
jgi:predicted nucleic acid-binding protein